MAHWFAHLLGRVVFRRTYLWVNDVWLSHDPLITCKRCGTYVNL